MIHVYAFILSIFLFHTFWVSYSLSDNNKEIQSQYNTNTRTMQAKWFITSSYFLSVTTSSYKGQMEQHRVVK